MMTKMSAPKPMFTEEQVQSMKKIAARYDEITEYALSHPDKEMTILRERIEAMNTMLRKTTPVAKIGDRVRIMIMRSIVVDFLDKVKLGNSSGRGRGVFATKDIKVGELITCYPGDLIKFIIRTLPDGREENQITLSDRYSDFITANGTKPDIDFSYFFRVDKLYGIIGDKELDNDPNYLGHFINDFCRTDGINHQRNMLYAKISIENSNCAIVPGFKGHHVVVIATVDIKKDDELFTTYGLDYWNDHHNRETNTKAKQ